MQQLDLFRQKYGALHDANMYACHYQYNQDGFWDTLQLQVDCYQITEELPHPFQRVGLMFSGVKSFILRQGLEGSGHLYLYGINYLFVDGHYHFDFSDEFETSIAKMQQESTFYIMSETFSFEVIKTLQLPD